jgi:hypothetical protein
MWYAVFDYSMLALICGVVTLICYLAIRQTFLSGPFYMLLPLPFLIYYFWKHCNTVFKKPASVSSLERAKEIDQVFKKANMDVSSSTHGEFSTNLFRQPSLAEGNIKAAVYRHTDLNATELRDLGSIVSLESSVEDSLYYLHEEEDDLWKENEEQQKELDDFLEDKTNPLYGDDWRDDENDGGEESKKKKNPSESKKSTSKKENNKSKKAKKNEQSSNNNNNNNNNNNSDSLSTTFNVLTENSPIRSDSVRNGTWAV